jgi:hypothetical protein
MTRCLWLTARRALDPYIRRPEHSDQAAEPVRAPRTFAQFRETSLLRPNANVTPTHCDEPSPGVLV